MYMFMIPQLSKHFYPWPCWEVIAGNRNLVNTNLVASRHVIKEKDSLLVNVHHSKMPVLKLCNNLWVLSWASMMFFNLYCKLKIYFQNGNFVLFNWVIVQSFKIKIINIFLLAELAMHSACCVSWPHISWCSCHWYNSHALTETGIIQRKLWGMISFEHNLWFLWMVES